jgi:hypothetical protein
MFDTVAKRESQLRQGPAGQSRKTHTLVNWTKRIAVGADADEHLPYALTWFSVILFILWQMVGNIDAKSVHDHYSHPLGAESSLKLLKNITNL